MDTERKLREALFAAYVDEAWNAYYTGYVDEDGMFDNCCMSYPEWLQGAVTGCRKRSKDVLAAWLNVQIADLAYAMVKAVVDGCDPHGVILGRTPPPNL
jgi:hypothetical protein